MKHIRSKRGVIALLLMLIVVIFAFQESIKALNEDLLNEPENVPMSTATQAAITKQATQYLAKQGSPYSFYFESLPAKSTPAQTSDVMLRSASLLKLPAVMNLYREAEDGSLDLDTVITLQPDWLDKNYGSLWQKGAGYKLSLREAARLALVDSDNTAINAVDFYVGQGNNGHSVYEAVPFTFSEDAQDKAYTTASAYTQFLRCLYQSCYLSRDDSQTILRQLTETGFPGITNGAPDIPIAHKIGETPKSYADCGIVYYPKHPYALCIMLPLAREQAVPIMSAISHMVYEDVKAAVR